VPWLEFFGILLKFAFVLYERMKKTPSEARRADLAEVDAAMLKAKEKKDLRDLSAWLGKHS
jgi:hypothetical protein